MVNGGKKLLNPLVAAQNFEYKMSNILGKPVFTVLLYMINVPTRQAFGKHFWLCICSTWSIQRVPLPVMRYYSHTYVTDPPR